MSSFASPLQTISALLSQKAEVQELITFAKQLPASLPCEDWLDRIRALSSVFAADLTWLTEGERQTLEWWTVRSMTQLFTRACPRPLPGYGEIRAAAEPFLKWLTAKEDYKVVEFCWEVRRSHHLNWHPGSHAVYALRDMDRLADDISLENLNLAVAIAGEADEMFWWPEERWEFARWSRDCEVYRDALSHSSYLVRAAAGKALGQVFIGCLKAGKEVPPISELLGFIGEFERKTAGIAGPFLNGVDWEWHWKDIGNGFDIDGWMLDTLRNSTREREVPHCQTLAFYAHEMFECNAEAILALLEMGRRSLAVMTATQCPDCIDKIRPVLDAMANSSDAEVSHAIQTYLVERTHHAGSDLITEPPFGLL